MGDPIKITVYTDLAEGSDIKQTYLITSRDTAKDLIRRILLRNHLGLKDPNLFYLTFQRSLEDEKGDHSDRKLPKRPTYELMDSSHPIHPRPHSRAESILTLYSDAILFRTLDLKKDNRLTLHMQTGGVLKIYDRCFSNPASIRQFHISKTTCCEELINLILTTVGSTDSANHFCLVEQDAHDKGRVLRPTDYPLLVSQTNGSSGLLILKNRDEMANNSKTRKPPWQPLNTRTCRSTISGRSWRIPNLFPCLFRGIIRSRTPSFRNANSPNLWSRDNVELDDATYLSPIMSNAQATVLQDRQSLSEYPVGNHVNSYEEPRKYPNPPSSPLQNGTLLEKPTCAIVRRPPVACPVIAKLSSSSECLSRQPNSAVQASGHIVVDNESPPLPPKPTNYQQFCNGTAVSKNRSFNNNNDNNDIINNVTSTSDPTINGKVSNPHTNNDSEPNWGSFSWTQNSLTQFRLPNSKELDLGVSNHNDRTATLDHNRTGKMETLTRIFTEVVDDESQFEDNKSGTESKPNNGNSVEQTPNSLSLPSFRPKSYFDNVRNSRQNPDNSNRLEQKWIEERLYSCKETITSESSQIINFPTGFTSPEYDSPAEEQETQVYEPNKNTQNPCSPDGLPTRYPGVSIPVIQMHSVLMGSARQPPLKPTDNQKSLTQQQSNQQIHQQKYEHEQEQNTQQTKTKSKSVTLSVDASRRVTDEINSESNKSLPNESINTNIITIVQNSGNNNRLVKSTLENDSTFKTTSTYSTISSAQFEISDRRTRSPLSAASFNKNGRGVTLELKPQGQGISNSYMKNVQDSKSNYPIDDESTIISEKHVTSNEFSHTLELDRQSEHSSLGNSKNMDGSNLSVSAVSTERMLTLTAPVRVYSPAEKNEDSTIQHSPSPTRIHCESPDSILDKTQEPTMQSTTLLTSLQTNSNPKHTSENDFGSSSINIISQNSIDRIELNPELPRFNQPIVRKKSLQDSNIPYSSENQVRSEFKTEQSTPNSQSRTKESFGPQSAQSSRPESETSSEEVTYPTLFDVLHHCDIYRVLLDPNLPSLSDQLGLRLYLTKFPLDDVQRANTLQRIRNSDGAEQRDMTDTNDSFQNLGGPKGPRPQIRPRKGSAFKPVDMRKSDCAFNVVTIESVEPDSPASFEGSLAAGHLLLEVDGKDLLRPNQFKDSFGNPISILHIAENQLRQARRAALKGEVPPIRITAAQYHSNFGLANRITNLERSSSLNRISSSKLSLNDSKVNSEFIDFKFDRSNSAFGETKWDRLPRKKPSAITNTTIKPSNSNIEQGHKSPSDASDLSDLPGEALLTLKNNLIWHPHNNKSNTPPSPFDPRCSDYPVNP